MNRPTITAPATIINPVITGNCCRRGGHLLTDALLTETEVVEVSLINDSSLTNGRKHIAAGRVSSGQFRSV
jgi:hypothetical protein